LRITVGFSIFVEPLAKLNISKNPTKLLAYSEAIF